MFNFNVVTTFFSIMKETNLDLERDREREAALLLTGDLEADLDLPLGEAEDFLLWGEADLDRDLDRDLYRDLDQVNLIRYHTITFERPYSLYLWHFFV